MNASTALPCCVNTCLAMVSVKVRRLLNDRLPVYLCDSEGTYKIRVFGVRVSHEKELLRVKTSAGWSTIWHSEKLVDKFGDTVFECRCRDEFDAEAFVQNIGILNSRFNVKEVF